MGTSSSSGPSPQGPLMPQISMQPRNKPSKFCTTGSGTSTSNDFSGLRILGLKSSPLKLLVLVAGILAHFTLGPVLAIALLAAEFAATFAASALLAAALALSAVVFAGALELWMCRRALSLRMTDTVAAFAFHAIIRSTHRLAIVRVVPLGEANKTLAKSSLSSALAFALARPCLEHPNEQPTRPPTIVNAVLALSDGASLAFLDRSPLPTSMSAPS